MSTFCLVTAFIAANGASVVNQINSYETISPEGKGSGRSHRIREFTLGRAFWLNKTSVESVLEVKIRMV